MSENGTAEAVDADALVTRVQDLTQQLEAIEDPAARDLAEELMAAIVQMYGAGLERIVAAIADAGPAGQEIMGALSRDGVAASLLLIHDLYPVSVEERVLEALDRVRPYMESHGGNVELLGVHEGIAHLRLEGSCKTCSASSATLELAVRQALEEAAPDLEGMEVEGVFEDEEEPTGPVLDVLQQPSWFTLEAAPGPEELVDAEVAGVPLVVANVEGTLLAYRDRCAACGAPLRGGELSAGALTCPGVQPQLLPAPSRALARRRRPPARARAAVAGGRGRAGRPVAVNGRLDLDAAIASRKRAQAIAGLRGFARGAEPAPRRRSRTSTATCAASASPTITATCSTSTSGRSCARARAAGRCARATPRTARSGMRTLWLEGFDLPDELWAGVPAADRPGLLPALQHDRLRGGDVPEPGRSHRERAALRLLGPAGRAQPGAGGPRARRRGADRQPALGPARLRDRADRPLLRARGADQDALGGHLRRLRGRESGRRASSTSCAPARCRHERRARSRPLRPRVARAGVHGARARPATATPRRRRSTSTSTSASRAGARSTPSRSACR